MSNYIKQVLVAGTGYMAKEYIKVLKALKAEYVVVGNRAESVGRFTEETGEQAYVGGVEHYISEHKELPECAIVAVSHGNLYQATKALAEAGVKKLLVEKPGVISFQEMEDLLHIADQKKTEIYIGYNRRFYQSVRKAAELIAQDGGLQLVAYEFTEWAHVVEKTPHPDEMKQKWFLLNSTHVADLVFYLTGRPRSLTAQIAGGLEWHKAGSIYTGCGVTERDIPFVYQADWSAPGRWGVELLTAKHRFYLRPLEKLQIQEIGSVKVEEYPIEDDVDRQYKAGLYEETVAFLSDDPAGRGLCTLEEHHQNMAFYQEISGEVY